MTASPGAKVGEKARAAASGPGGTGARHSPVGSPGELVPWLLVLVFGALGLVPLGDPDVWWHLRTGQWIVEHGALPHRDPWSFASSQAWIPHEWLSQVAMYAAYATGGYRGLILLHGTLLAAIGAIVVWQARRRAGWLATTVVTVICLVAVMPGSNERPQLASFALLAYFGPRLLTAIETGKAPWLFVPLVYLWANLHGLWAAAIVVYGAVVLAHLGQLGRRWRRGLPFVSVGAGMVAAAALTPSGPRLLLTPMTVRAYAKFSSEWSAPQLYRSWTFACAILLAIVVYGWARSREPVPVGSLAYVAATVVVGFGYNRTIPVAAVLLAPLAAQSLARSIRSPAGRPRWPVPLKAITGVVVAAVAVGAAAWLPSARTIAPYAPSIQASHILDALPGRARVLNEYELGGWLLWTARDVSPGIDGRTEIYRPAYVRSYLDTLRATGDWRGFVAASHVQAAWLYRKSPLVESLVSQLRWRTVWTDGTSVILLPPPTR
jgi:hypothetical protein